MEKKILIIDSSDFGKETAKMTLEEAGYKVITANEGMEGLYKLKREKIDLIIVELALSGLDGFGILSIVKNDPATKHIPVLVLTDRDTREEKEEAVKLGAVDCIVKYRLPPVELLKIVRTILEE
jgi:DNA-binding response OmpR family regulator